MPWWRNSASDFSTLRQMFLEDTNPLLLVIRADIVPPAVLDPPSNPPYPLIAQDDLQKLRLFTCCDTHVCLWVHLIWYFFNKTLVLPYFTRGPSLCHFFSPLNLLPGCIVYTKPPRHWSFRSVRSALHFSPYCFGLCDVETVWKQLKEQRPLG